MSLLPIIYSSLIITGGLILIAFTISYISYKWKNKGEYKSINSVPSELRRNNMDRTKKPIDPATRINNNKSQRPVINNRAIPKNRTVILSHNPKSNTAFETRKRENRSPDFNQQKINSDSRPKMVRNVTVIKPDYMKKSSVGKIRNRLEIVNPINMISRESMQKGTEKRYSDYRAAERHIPSHPKRDNQTEISTMKSTLFAQTGT